MTAQPVTAQPVQAIHVQGLEKSYKKLRALRGVDFDVARGSIFALLGSNGAGKTTVVKILSTLLKLDAGTATVDGFDVAAQPANVRESISLTGQFAAVDEILTGRENLVLMARLRHLKDAGQIADDLLARFQLTDAAGRPGWPPPRPTGLPPSSPTPRADATSAVTSLPAATPASSTTCTTRCSAWALTACARRVLPRPPVPTIDVTRDVRSRPATAAMSSSRPSSGLGSCRTPRRITGASVASSS